jgi:hypothetical protein
MNEAAVSREMTTEEWARDLRVRLDVLEKEVLSLRGRHLASKDGNVPEVQANIMLAYRHLEDARMRLGKVIQHLGDGVSVYDKAPEVQS